ncbi:MAG TPA: HAD family phosphatase, partial [Archangium sp.]
MTTPPRALLLDLGNVLVFHDNGLLFRRLGARAGLAPAEAERRLSGTGWTAANRGLLGAEGIRRDVCGSLGVDLPAEEFNALWSSHFTPHEAVLPRVEGLVGRVKLVLVSNTNVLHVAYLRPKLPVLERFDSLVLSCEVGLVKPEPAIFKEA